MITLDELNVIFQQVFCDDSLIITRETTANDVEDWDSLTHMTLIVSIEGQLGIKFSLGELMPLKNVGELLDLTNAVIAK
jgi:acyl carrier protein